MHLLLHEGIHITLSFIAGFIVWKIYKKSWVTMGAAFLTGVFLDLDHLIDYFLVYGMRFDLNSFLKGNQFALSEKIYVLFHGFEYCAILFCVFLFLKKKTYKMIVLALMLGMLSHLLYDTYDNEMKPLSYLISYRIVHNFDLKELVPVKHYQETLRKKELLQKTNKHE